MNWISEEELARLIALPNVLVTAHHPFPACEAPADIAPWTVVKLTSFAAGQPLEEGSVLA